jgi:phage tail protein X
MNVIAQQGDTVDLLCWRHYGRTSGTVETVLEANGGLADYGVVLPHGLSVYMPDLAEVDTTTPMLQLFD